jgi:CRP-like cAMP-binding protein
MQKIIRVLNSFAPLSQKDCNSFLSILTSRDLNKGDYWIEEGKKNNRVAFLEEGYLRKYYIKDGNEVTDSFYFENDFCADLPSIIGNSPPHGNIIAMQKTTLTIFSYNDFNQLCKNSPGLEHLNRVIVEFTFLRFYKRAVSFIMQTPKERYNELVATNPAIIQKATQYHIASYLGISPQHLSRLRSGK